MHYNPLQSKLFSAPREDSGCDLRPLLCHLHLRLLFLRANPPTHAQTALLLRGWPLQRSQWPEYSFDDAGDNPAINRSRWLAVRERSGPGGIAGDPGYRCQATEQGQRQLAKPGSVRDISRTTRRPGHPSAPYSEVTNFLYRGPLTLAESLRCWISC